MKIAKLVAPNKFEFFDMPYPELKPGHVIVRVVASGICGSDVHIFHTLRASGKDVKEPLALGHEAAGVVEEVASDVKGFHAGQRVFIEPQNTCGHCEWCLRGDPNLCPNVLFLGMPGQDGAYRKYISVPAHTLFPTPPEIETDEEAVMIEPFSISLSAFYLAKCKMPATVAIQGCGTMGLSLLQILKWAGAKTIISTDPLDYRLDAAKRLGADYTINPAKEDVFTKVMEITKGEGIDYVFEASGVDETPKEACRIAKIGAKVLIIGANEKDDIVIDGTSGRVKGLTIIMVRRAKNTVPKTIDMFVRKILDPKPLITHRFNLDDIEKGFDIVANYKDNVIKAMIIP